MGLQEMIEIFSILIFMRVTKDTLDTMEKFHIYIYNITQSKIQINDKNIVKPNIIFETLIRGST
jgi:hypothetical protein